MTVAGRFTRWWRTMRDIAGPVIVARTPRITTTIRSSKMENPLSPRVVAFLLELVAILNASVGGVGVSDPRRPSCVAFYLEKDECGSCRQPKKAQWIRLSPAKLHYPPKS